MAVHPLTNAQNHEHSNKQVNEPNTNEPPACNDTVEPTTIRSQMSNQQQQHDNEDTDDSQRPMYAMSASLSPGAGGERSRR